MTRTLLAMVILCLSVTGGLARHLMHNIPLDVGGELEDKCNKEWPSSGFSQGSCIDKDAAEWLRTHPGENGRRRPTSRSREPSPYPACSTNRRIRTSGEPATNGNSDDKEFTASDEFGSQRGR